MTKGYSTVGLWARAFQIHSKPLPKKKNPLLQVFALGKVRFLRVFALQL